MTLRRYGLTAPKSTRSLSSNTNSRVFKFAPRFGEMASPSVDMACLAERVQALPQELFDVIYRDVFTPDQRQRVIWPETRPPARLQVDRHSRQLFATAYYGSGASFDFHNMSEDLLIRWLQSLPAGHRALLRHIIFTIDRSEAKSSKYEVSSWEASFRGWVATSAMKSRLLRQLSDLGVADGENVLLVL